MNKSLYAFFCICFFIFGCNTDIEFVQYQQLEQSTWKAKDSIKFYFKIQDTIHQKNLFIHIRNNQKYPFSNLYVITHLEYPNKNVVIDTLQYQMADEHGVLLGTGLSSIKESKLFYKEKFRFSKSGNYKIFIYQAMRRNASIETIDIDGVNNIGFSIEKTE